jgi:co-chaperonin GroES (HSP10)
VTSLLPREMAAAGARQTTLVALLLGWLGCSEALHVGLTTSGAARMRSPAPAMLEAQAAKPLANMVLVELDKKPSQSSGGILMPTAFSDDPNNALDQFKAKELRKGTVLEVGPGRLSQDGQASSSIDFKPGQQVMVAAVDGIKVEPDGPTNKAVFLFKAEEVWATIA